MSLATPAPSPRARVYSGSVGNVIPCYRRARSRRDRWPGLRPITDGDPAALPCVPWFTSATISTEGSNMPGFASATAILLAAAGLTATQPVSGLMVPRIRVPSGERPVEIAALDVRVVIHGLHPETTATVTFLNPNGRVLEGDLEFPLPDGATVSGFGLDVARPGAHRAG